MKVTILEKGIPGNAVHRSMAHVRVRTPEGFYDFVVPENALHDIHAEDVVGNEDLKRSIFFANRALDAPSQDPDDDLRTVSRQLLRALDRENEKEKRRLETEFTFSISLANLFVKVQIPGEPQAWERPNWNGARAFDTKANKIAKATIRQYIGLAYPRLEMNTGDRFGVVLLFATKLWDTDADNYTKLVLDASKKFVWRDDRQVDELFVRVARGNVVPRTQLFFYLLREAPQL